MAIIREYVYSLDMHTINTVNKQIVASGEIVRNGETFVFRVFIDIHDDCGRYKSLCVILTFNTESI